MLGTFKRSCRLHPDNEGALKSVGSPRAWTEIRRGVQSWRNGGELFSATTYSMISFFFFLMDLTLNISKGDEFHFLSVLSFCPFKRELRLVYSYHMVEDRCSFKEATCSNGCCFGFRQT